MSKKRSLRFSIVRGALAIGIALLVAFLLILLSSSGNTFGDKIDIHGIYLYFLNVYYY